MTKIIWAGFPAAVGIAGRGKIGYISSPELP
jgi:hypothetical protein